jgi:hypothetical protein
MTTTTTTTEGDDERLIVSDGESAGAAIDYVAAGRVPAIDYVAAAVGPLACVDDDQAADVATPMCDDAYAAIAAAIKRVLLDFLDELMTLFETKNKFIYRRLINVHHAIANVHDDSTVERACRDLFARERERIKRRDARLLTGTPFEFDADCIWNELSVTNRALVWKWIDEIDARMAVSVGDLNIGGLTAAGESGARDDGGRERRG